jgi:hypothetical protein
MLETLIRKTLPAVAVHAAMEEPSNFFRFVLHYRFGVPALGRFSFVRSALAGWSAFVRAVWPARTWAYSIVELRHQAHGRLMSVASKIA